MHLKRNEMPKTWPIPRKGTKYLLVANHAKKNGIPVLFVIRDMLKLAKTRNEVKFMLYNKQIKVNNKFVKEEKFPMEISDVLSIEKIGKNYRIDIVDKKFKLEEISEKEAGKKVAKIIGKKIIGKNKVQMNLSDGRNFFAKEIFSVGDSALINLKENKIEKIIKLKEGTKVEIISGKHIGKTGNINGINQVGKQKMFLINIEKKEINLPLKTIKAIE